MRNAAILCAAVSFAACAAGDDAATSTIVRDSAGITIVENTFPDSADAEWWSIESVPLLDIGGEGVPETHAVFRVADVAQLGDGRVVVVNGGASDIRYYAQDGAHLATSGKQGEGPGEFQRPASLLVLPDDSLIVVDQRAARATVLDSAGAYVRDFRPEAGGQPVVPVGRLADGTLIATRTNVLRDGSPPTTGLISPEVLVFSLLSDGTIDTLAAAPGAERYLEVGTQSINISTLAFGREPSYAVTGDLVVMATQTAPSILFVSRDGDAKRILRTGRAMVPVTDAEKSALVEATADPNDPAGKAAFAERLTKQSAEFVPPYDHVVAADDGSLWVADYARHKPAERGLWTVYDAEGRFAARIRLPASFVPHQIGEDYVLGVETDELDVEHVRKYRLNRS